MSENAAVESLLSLSVAAANAEPISLNQDFAPSSFTPGSFHGPSSLPHGGHLATSKIHNALKHRRLSSTGQAKRRLSDAREAASRPSAQTIQTAAAALNSLATLSLTGSPPPQAIPQTSTSFTSAVGHFTAADAVDDGMVKQEEEEHSVNGSTSHKGEISAAGITIKSANGKKRGTIYKCESCSKIYRHPSCLVKHRWEHSPHWREASKFMLSKHQQVQLLEAAAILTHMSPSSNGGSSLPEDRSLWPSFLSGGLLPPPSSGNGVVQPNGITPQNHPDFDTHTAFHVSCSVPVQSALSMSRPTSTGPRLHDYSIAASNVTHVRPGVVTVSTGTSPAPTPVLAPSAPLPMPVTMDRYRDVPRGVSVSSDRWDSPISYSAGAGGHSYETGGSWSLPRSSVRSRSASTPKSDGSGSGDIEVDIVGVGEDAFDGERLPRYGAFVSRGRTSDARGAWKEEDAAAGDLRAEKIEEEWDGEMEMEM
ncbi:hypothetical protein EIP86_003874 [Pleurotus ostreatoroseus]|nr:hypothetical protein EIP86_003874 [Pleurotus ostreatoroseus]